MIDVNGSRHHLFLGSQDWDTYVRSGNDADYDLDKEAVTIETNFFRFNTSSVDPEVELEKRRGAACDLYGHWYWIGPKRQSIRVCWSETAKGVKYWAADDPPATCREQEPSVFKSVDTSSPPLPETLQGLSVTAEFNMLVVGAPDTGSLLVFDLHSGGSPSRITLPSPPGESLDAMTKPYDIAALSRSEDKGCVVILDQENKLLWELDASLSPRRYDASEVVQKLRFQPVDATEQERLQPQPRIPLPIDLSHDDLGPGVTELPISVEGLNDGTFIVLIREKHDAQYSWILRRYHGKDREELSSKKLSDINILMRDETFGCIQGHDMAFVPGDGKEDDTLFVVDSAGDQAFALKITLHDREFEVALKSQYYPLRNYTGKALVTPPQARKTYFDQADRWKEVLVMNRPNYKERADITLPKLDGGNLDCVWHRLCIDACIPPEANVRVYTRAADDEGTLQWQPWRAEPEFYKRPDEAEIPYYTLWSKDDLRNPHTGTWELIFQSARGRYLDILLELTGNTRVTPAIRALRVHYPRFSYLTNYLPAVYQEDRSSANFLDRFLANPEGLLTKLEGWIANAQSFFDVRSVPGGGALEWLAAWLGLALDPTWSDFQRRLLVAHAPTFYRWRGTITGIMQSIRLAIDPTEGPEIFQGEYQENNSGVRIVEMYRNRYKAQNENDVPSSQDLPIDETVPDIPEQELAHQFVVLLPDQTTDETLGVVERLLELEKPAFSYFRILRYFDMFRVGEVRLGIDTRLGDNRRFTRMILGQTGLAAGKLDVSYPFNLADREVVSD